MGHTANRVSFATSASAARPADDEEHDVMSRFSRHAARCATCADPVEAYRSQGRLCDSGNKYARDVAQYIYSKNGKAYSVVDRQQRHEKIQVELPAGCGVIKSLCKAVDDGLSVRREQAAMVVDARSEPRMKREKAVSRPVVVDARTEKPAYAAAGAYDTVTVRPASSREEKRRRDGRERSDKSSPEKRKSAVYVKGRGSLYEKDEAERRARDAQGPIILDVSPRGGRYLR